MLTFLSALWGIKAFRYAAAVIGVVLLAVVFIKQREAAAVERAALESKLAAVKESLRIANLAIKAEEVRARERAQENLLLRVEIDGFKSDLATGVTAACPPDSAYTDRMRALWPHGAGGSEPAGPSG